MFSFTWLNFPRFTNIKLSNLSKINRDKFFLCRELLRSPSVIFFDQSPIHQQTESLLCNLKQISNLGKTVVCTLEMASFRLVPLLKTKINNVYMHIYIYQDATTLRQNIITFQRKACLLRWYFRSVIKVQQDLIDLETRYHHHPEVLGSGIHIFRWEGFENFRKMGFYARKIGKKSGRWLKNVNSEYIQYINATLEPI